LSYCTLFGETFLSSSFWRPVLFFCGSLLAHFPPSCDPNGSQARSLLRRFGLDFFKAFVVFLLLLSLNESRRFLADLAAYLSPDSRDRGCF